MPTHFALLRILHCAVHTLRAVTHAALHCPHTLRRVTHAALHCSHTLRRVTHAALHCSYTLRCVTHAALHYPHTLRCVTHAALYCPHTHFALCYACCTPLHARELQVGCQAIKSVCGWGLWVSAINSDLQSAACPDGAGLGVLFMLHVVSQCADGICVKVQSVGVHPTAGHEDPEGQYSSTFSLTSTLHRGG